MVTFKIFENETAVHDYKSGETIFAQNQPGDVMYAVLSGEVDIVRDQRLLETIGSGCVFGEMAIIDGLPRSAAAIARTDCRVATISEHRFNQLVSHNTYFALEMMRLLCERLRRNLST